jgi:predicted aspartyl protease
MKEDLKLKAKVKIANPADLSRYEDILLMVDTGSPFSIVSKDRLKRLGISPIRKRRLKLANGEIIERDWGILYFEIEGKGEGGSDVIFGGPNDAELLGLHALEAMALSINTTTGELKPIEPLYLL